MSSGVIKSVLVSNNYVSCLRPFRRAPCDAHSAMAPELHACLSTIRRPPGQCTTSAVLARRLRGVVHARVSSGCTWRYARLAISILCRTLRLRAPHRHDCWNQYGYSYWDQRFALCLYTSRTSESPYQNSFLGLIWFVAQKLRRRRHKDWGLDGESRSVGSNMAQGQMQLAMEETEGRNGRDKRGLSTT